MSSWTRLWTAVRKNCISLSDSMRSLYEELCHKRSKIKRQKPRIRTIRGITTSFAFAKKQVLSDILLTYLNIHCTFTLCKAITFKEKINMLYLNDQMLTTKMSKVQEQVISSSFSMVRSTFRHLIRTCIIDTVSSSGGLDN